MKIQNQYTWNTLVTNTKPLGFLNLNLIWMMGLNNINNLPTLEQLSIIQME